MEQKNRIASKPYAIEMGGGCSNGKFGSKRSISISIAPAFRVRLIFFHYTTV
jgi:hypothetical protein